jgi:anti-sigma regulatory factor (Ser/Thr protein kinase)
MKNFLQKILEEKDMQSQPPAHAVDHNGPTVRLAVYDSLTSIPRVTDLSANDYEELINLLATKTYQFSQEKGGRVPFTVIKEVVENLVHAYFKEAVITVLDNGNTIRISDQGPGIQNKEKAFLPGFSTAAAAMKKVIKGVGSGLPIVKETLLYSGGKIIVEDNLNQGTVITLSVPKDIPQEQPQERQEEQKEPPVSSSHFSLNKRQKGTLFLITELGRAGPSKIATELDVSLSTAYRDLIYLEKLNLIKSDEQGKRSLTTEGIQRLDKILYS